MFGNHMATSWQPHGCQNLTIWRGGGQEKTKWIITDKA